MQKKDLETRLKAIGTFVKNHKTSCFLAGSALYAANVYLGYYKAAESIKQGDYGHATVLYGLSYLPAVSGTILMGTSSFYIAKKVLGRKRAAKTFNYLSKFSNRRKKRL